MTARTPTEPKQHAARGPRLLLLHLLLAAAASGQECEADSCTVHGASMIQTKAGVNTRAILEEQDGGRDARLSHRAYVPGTPGASWTTDQMLAIKAKLMRVFQETENIARETPTSWRIKLPKYVRLGFHDCMRYRDGSGGCDGCLDWTGVGIAYPMGNRNTSTPDDHNNGLEDAVLVLEKIYTRRKFPRKTPVLPQSPKNLGISRADLWAFAAMVAVDFGIKFNNAACTMPDIVRSESFEHECHPRVGQPDCLVSAPRPFRFSTGRRDCAPDSSLAKPYMTLKRESAPDAGANGTDVLSWFESEFNFSGRETAAIMGGHNFGGFDVEVSSFEYTWKTRSGSMFNNGYYRNLVGKPEWYFPTKILPNGTRYRKGPGGGTCQGVGNSSGGRPVARWKPNAFGNFPNGGPTQWVQEKFVCGCYGPQDAPNTCCAGGDPFGCAADDGNGNACEVWRFVLGKDETMLNTDMGLYRNFSVSGGIPTSTGSCPGLVMGLGNGDWESSQCPLNTMLDSPGGTPMHQIIEEYADSTQRFFADFFPAYEKMLTNGVAAADLTTIDMPDMECEFQEVGDPDRMYTCELVGGR